MERTTVFSSCRTYRYTLWRSWSMFNDRYAMFVGLNPSTADEIEDDPTIRRCIGFAKSWGYGALCMTNIFAFRATDPKVMRAYPEPVGPDNDRWLTQLSTDAGIVIAAWGVHGAHRNRGESVMAMLPGLKCLGVTKDGFPKHPLYLSRACIPVDYGTRLE